ncbi:MAG: thioesterase family protein [Pseudomonadota bacterium]|nr:thioesterase family protein [Pseudomonadota bacterium]
MIRKVWQKDLQIYIEHTDCTGVVYHSKYLHFFEQARSDILQSICKKNGFDVSRLYQCHGFFVVRSVNIRYTKAMKLPDKARIESCFSRVSPVRTLWKQRVICLEGESVYVEADVEIVFVNKAMRPQRMPAWLMSDEMEEAR